MGRPPVLTVARRPTTAWLLATAALLAAGCSGPEGSPHRGHAELACAACHQGDVADAGLPSVSPSTCTSSGCHGRNVPAEIRLSTVTFEHRGHGADADVALGCAGCHTHQSGGEPLTASVDACGLCHAEQMDGDDGQECARCHSRPDQVTSTSQGVPVPHEGLPWVSRSCVRCHYDVSEPPQQVPITRCRNCHYDLEATAAGAVGRDLHPGHAGVACVSCHEAGSHRIVAMSSTVFLDCGDCHVRAHDAEVRPGWGSGTCVACHRDSHQAQQRLVLGLAGAGLEPMPSEKFMAGLVCRSCHVRPSDGESPDVLRSGPDGCAECHEPRYTRVLRWWEEGLDQRGTLVRRYVDRGRATLAGTPAPDSVRILLDGARDLLDLVRTAGGEHNLRLAHRIFLESLDRTARAYELSGRSAPERPYLGRQPSMGLCSYCHYRLDDPMEFREMPEDFHVRVMRR